MWSLYYLIQQKCVRYCSPFNRNVWKKTNGDRNYLKQHKYVEFLLLWSQFSSSAWTIFKNHLLKVGVTQNWETMTLRILTTINLFYFIMREDLHE